MKSYITKVSIGLLLGAATLSGVTPLKSAMRGDKGGMIRIERHEKDGGVSKSYFRYGSTNIPADDKKQKGGEDAWVASNNLLVVADGVGGWAAKGIDSGLYSKTLVAEIKRVFDHEPSHELRQTLVEAAQGIRHKGSATVVAAKFDTSRWNYIRTATLGDSGYMILRPSAKEEGKFRKIFRSEEQQREFNFPFQMGTGHEGEEFKAFDNDHEVKDLDILIMFSDGVSDNLYDADLAKCVNPYLNGQNLRDLKGCSECIAKKAYELGKNQDYLSPFAKNARAAGKTNWPSQGKPDDIVAICSQVHTSGDQPPQEIQSNGLGMENYQSKWTVSPADAAGASAAAGGDL